MIILVFPSFISCHKLNNSTPDDTDKCAGFTSRYGEKNWDSLKYMPTLWWSTDSIENGYRVFTVKIQSDKAACYNDSIHVIIVAGFKENQPRPIGVRAYLEADYTDHTGKFSRYFEKIPMKDSAEMWTSAGHNSFWNFFPEPHVDGAPYEYFYIYIDFLVPVHGNSQDDWLYLCAMSEGLAVTYYYWASPS